ncbi:MAG: response regulator transcription factor [Gorillibacterium sp.]|nr:response regulator transcription factor [Gorillibacterium sp.]
MESIRLLVVEDDVEINELICSYLRKENYQVLQAFNGQEALERLQGNLIHMVILDLMLPIIDGFEVMRHIRAKSRMPILILSAKREETDKIIGLGLGADDYMEKPFSVRELVARTKAALRRSFYLAEPVQQAMQYGDIILDPENGTITKGGSSVSATAKEFLLLKTFFSYPKKIFTKAQLFDSVWGENYETDDNTVTVHIRRLRIKIEDDPSHPRYVETVWGIGYRLGDFR